MTRTMMRLALAAVLAAPAASMAQPTPEGTVISNTATASWTDANGNTYANVTATANVTVGYLVSVDVNGTSPATPGSPSTGNTQSFTITNNGNGTDSVSVAASAGAGATITEYAIGATPYADLAALNLALSQTALAAGGSVTVTVTYSVAAGQGGQSISLALTATSRRQSSGTGSSDTYTTLLQPAVAAAVAVTPDGGTVDRVPSNGVATYTQVFTVANNGNASDTYTVLASTSTGAAVTIVSVNGTPGTGGSVVVASGGTGRVTVAYTVGNVAALTTDSLRLLATSGNNNTLSDYGAIQVRVVRAALAIAKVPYKDNQTTVIDPAAPIAANRVALPGEYIQYRISVTNNGGAPATSVAITDPVSSAHLQNITASPDVAGTDWSISTAAGVSATLTVPLAAGATRFIWVRAQVRP